MVAYTKPQQCMRTTTNELTIPNFLSKTFPTIPALRHIPIDLEKFPLKNITIDVRQFNQFRFGPILGSIISVTEVI